MMTVREMRRAVGQTVLVRMEAWAVPCMVTDARFVWGRPQLLVAPVSGQGEAWIELGRVIANLAAAGSAVTCGEAR